MSRLYIANVTRQNHVINYRLEFTKSGEVNARQNFQPARQQQIDAGRQNQLGSDFHIKQIEDIIDQLKPFGLIGESDVPRMENRFYPYVFNIDKFVSERAMRAVRDHNAGIKFQEGVDRRAKAAVAANEVLQSTVANQFAENGINAEPSDQVDVTIEQLEQTEENQTMVAEGFHLRPGGQERAERDRGKPGKTARKRSQRKSN